MKLVPEQRAKRWTEEPLQRSRQPRQAEQSYASIADGIASLTPNCWILLRLTRWPHEFRFRIDTCKRADGGFLSYGRGALRAIAYPGPGDECAAFPIPAAPRLPYALVNTGNDTRAIQAWMWHKNIEHTCAIPSWRRNGLRILAAEASCDGLEYGSSRNLNVI